MSAKPFANLVALAGQLREELKNKKFVVLYAHNGTGKTRLSSEFKTLGKKLDAEGETITCDPHRLQQMIWNLLTNAVKFTPPDGHVEIKLEQISDAVKITISDTGQGISPEFLPFVFDRFRQADSSSARTSTNNCSGPPVLEPRLPRRCSIAPSKVVRLLRTGRGIA